MRFVEYKFKNKTLGYAGPAMKIDAKAVDTERRAARWTLSEETPDRARVDADGRPTGDIVRVKGIDFKDYQANPVLLQFHDYERHSIGIVEDIAVEGNKFKGTPVFNPAGLNPDADIIWGQIAAGHHRAGSIGFIANKAEEIKGDDEDPYGYRPRDFKSIYLLEFSMVPIPMLQTALIDRSGDADEYALLEVASDIIGHNEARTEAEVRRLIQRFGDRLFESWAKANDWEPAPVESEPEEPHAEPVDDAPAKKAVEDIVRQAIEDARHKHSVCV